MEDYYEGTAPKHKKSDTIRGTTKNQVHKYQGAHLIYRTDMTNSL